MNYLRSIGFALAGMFSACMGVVSCLVEPLVYSLIAGYTDMACGVAKLKRELVHQFNESAQAMTGIGCGLTAESNGFRQSSATTIGAEERTALAI